MSNFPEKELEPTGEYEVTGQFCKAVSMCMKSELGGRELVWGGVRNRTQM